MQLAQWRETQSYGYTVHSLDLGPMGCELNAPNDEYGNVEALVWIGHLENAIDVGRFDTVAAAKLAAVEEAALIERRLRAAVATAIR